MREILFRGKRVDNGEWVEGQTIVVIHQDDNDLIFMPQHGEDVKADPMEDNDRALTSIYGNYYQILPQTVEQYTGLTDKNGKKIFEGDVLNVHDQIPMFDGYDTDEIVYNGKVMYIKNQGMYVCEGNNDGNALCALNLDKCEVIGNIHDNPELLEVSEE